MYNLFTFPARFGVATVSMVMVLGVISPLRGVEPVDNGASISSLDSTDSVLSIAPRGFTVGHVTLGAVFGSSQAEYYFDTILPVLTGPDSILFLNPQVSMHDDYNESINLGIGYRKACESWNMIFGFNAFYDYSKSPYGNGYNQLGLGLELLWENFSIRLNGFLPDQHRELIAVGMDSSTRTSTSTSRRASTTSDVSTSQSSQIILIRPPNDEVTQPALLTTTRTRRTDTTLTRASRKECATTVSRLYGRHEDAMPGLELEAGGRLPGPDLLRRLQLFGGFYAYDDPFGGDVTGFKARAQFDICKYCFLDAEYYGDERLLGDQWFFGLRVSLPLGRDKFPHTRLAGSSSASAALLSRMGEKIIRPRRVHFSEGPWESMGSSSSTDCGTTTSSRRSQTVTDTFKDEITLLDQVP